MIASKIGLLPENIRQQLNRRLQMGENGAALLEWLNALPEAQTAFVAESSDPKVTEEHVSNWQQGGYRDWLAQQEAMAHVRRVVAEAKELSRAADGALTDSLAIWTAGRYAIAARQLAAESKNGALDWNLLRVLCNDLVNLRRGDHRAESLRMERERLEMERAEKKEDLEKLCREWAKENQEKICEGFMTRKQKINELRRVMFGDLPDEERMAIVGKVDEIMGLRNKKAEHDNEDDSYSI